MTIHPSDADRILARKLDACIAEPAVREQFVRELGRYGECEHEGEVHRVRLAILKDGGANLKEIRILVEVAKTDYRDVLSGAEYPNQSKIGFATMSKLSESELGRLVQLDLEQYEKWLAE